MVEQLPQYLVLRSIDDYVCFEYESDKERGFLKCSGKSVFEPYAKIEVEQAKISAKYVHLRFCTPNKYWGRPKPDESWIVASFDKAEEDVTKQSCTLFEPIYMGERVNFIHVPSKWHLSIHRATSHLILDQTARLYFNIVDWNTLVKMPNRVAFKAHNGKYVRDYWHGYRSHKHPFLQVTSEDGNADGTSFEVHLQPDGHVRIKSVQYNKFWRLSPAWIWSDSQDETGKDKDTLFWPVKIDGKTVALRNAGNNRFVKPISAEYNDDCLNAAAENHIPNEAKFIVEELVLKRSFHNIRYRPEEGRVFGEKPIMAGENTAYNYSDEESTMAVPVEYEETTSSTFTHGFSFTEGVAATFETGVPFILDGKVDVNVESTQSFEWNETTTTTKKAGASIAVTVPPKSKVRVSYMATQGKCDVPFSYTQEDESSTDGQIIRTHHNDGTYNGVSRYSYQFIQDPASPL